jgi:ribosome-associated heat shock protein Hsp15
MAAIISMMDDRHRIDLWLKHVCLFKHRTEATEALRGGLVKVNGQRVKPATVVREGDVIEWFAGESLRRFVVRTIPPSQQSKEAARTMYEDQSPPPAPREVTIYRDRGAGRPTKKERREIEKLRR